MTEHELQGLYNLIESLTQELKHAQSQIEALTLDVHFLEEELEIARRPKMDER